jgi:hypothetical protein
MPSVTVPLSAALRLPGSGSPVQSGLRAITTSVSPGQSQKILSAQRFASSARTSPAKSSRRSPNRCGAEDERLSSFWHGAMAGAPCRSEILLHQRLDLIVGERRQPRVWWPRPPCHRVGDECQRAAGLQHVRNGCRRAWLRRPGECVEPGGSDHDGLGEHLSEPFGRAKAGRPADEIPVLRVPRGGQESTALARKLNDSQRPRNE